MIRSLYRSPDDGGGAGGGASSGAELAVAATPTDSTTSVSQPPSAVSQPPSATADPTAPNSATPKTYTEAEFNALKAKLAGVETENKKFKDAQLTDQQRLEQRAKEAEERLTDHETSLRQERLERAIERQARALNIVDEDAALALLDKSQIVYDEAGKPTNVDALLKSLVEAKPYLVQDAPPRSSGSPTNPARGQSAAGVFTTSQLNDPKFYRDNEAAIRKAASEGRIIVG